MRPYLSQALLSEEVEESSSPSHSSLLYWSTKTMLLVVREYIDAFLLLTSPAQACRLFEWANQIDLYS